ncbi:MAG: pyridoxamine 5'-phosphate oxidase family protein [Planctomycetota bacterium]
MEDCPKDIDGIIRRAWALLGRGCADRRHAFHTPALATVDEAGLPNVRTVVLRIADAEQRVLACHCDQRSNKVEEIAITGHATWHFYDAGHKTQLVIATDARVHTDDEVAAERWAATGRGSRVCYERPYAPGTRAEAPYDERPQSDDPEAGRANFAVIRGVATTIDYLHLHHAGHVRCRLVWSEGWHATWLTP